MPGSHGIHSVEPSPDWLLKPMLYSPGLHGIGDIAPLNFSDWNVLLYEVKIQIKNTHKKYYVYLISLYY